MNSFIKETLYIFIAITLGVLAVKFVIWLLPIILAFLISHYIYNSIKQTRVNKNKKKVKKTIKIIEMVEDED